MSPCVGEGHADHLPLAAEHDGQPIVTGLQVDWLDECPHFFETILRRSIGRNPLGAFWSRREHDAQGIWVKADPAEPLSGGGLELLERWEIETLGNSHHTFPGLEKRPHTEVIRRLARAFLPQFSTLSLDFLLNSFFVSCAKVFRQRIGDGLVQELRELCPIEDRHAAVRTQRTLAPWINEETELLESAMSKKRTVLAGSRHEKAEVILFQVVQVALRTSKVPVLKHADPFEGVVQSNLV